MFELPEGAEFTWEFGFDYILAIFIYALLWYFERLGFWSGLGAYLACGLVTYLRAKIIFLEDPNILGLLLWWIVPIIRFCESMGCTDAED